MSIGQRGVIVLAIAAISLLVLYPPWYYEYEYEPVRRGEQKAHMTRPAGHHPIWDGVPNDQTMLINLFAIDGDKSDLRYFTMRIDKDMVWLEIGAILIVGTLLWFLFRTRNRIRHE